MLEFEQVLKEQPTLAEISSIATELKSLREGAVPS
jgi:hypothetical protein